MPAILGGCRKAPRRCAGDASAVTVVTCTWLGCCLHHPAPPHPQLLAPHPTSHHHCLFDSPYLLPRTPSPPSPAHSPHPLTPLTPLTSPLTPSPSSPHPHRLTRSPTHPQPPSSSHHTASVPHPASLHPWPLIPPRPATTHPGFWSRLLRSRPSAVPSPLAVKWLMTSFLGPHGFPSYPPHSTRPNAP